MSDNKMVLSVREVSEMLSIGRNLCYELIRGGLLPSIRLGKRRLVVPKAALQDFLERTERRSHDGT